MLEKTTPAWSYGVRFHFWPLRKNSNASIGGTNLNIFMRRAFRIAICHMGLFILTACQTAKMNEVQTLNWRFFSSPEQFGKMAHSLCGSMDGNFFAFGGIREGSDSPLNSQIIFYDSKLKTWKALDNRNGPTARNLASLAFFDHSIFVFGGETGGKPFTNEAFVYDVTQEQWITLKNTESTDARKMATATLVGNHMIIYGGKGNSVVSNWSKYDTKLKQWNTFQMGNMDSRVSHVAVSLSDSQLFVWGGWVGTERQSNGFILDINTQHITAVPSSSALSARSNARAIRWKDQVYIWGGSTVDGNSNSGAVFDLALRHWEALPAIPDKNFNNLKGAETVLWGEEGILLVGGRFGSEAFNQQLWFLDFKGRTWKQLSTKNQLPGRIAHCATALSPNTVAVFGGIGYSEGLSLNQFGGIWVLSPSIEKDFYATPLGRDASPN